MINIDPSDAILIFGTSEDIKRVHGNFHELKEKYDSIGINRFHLHYDIYNKNTKNYWIWSDFGWYTCNIGEYNRHLLNNYNVITTFEVNSKELNKGLVYYNNDKIQYKDNAIIPYYLFDAVRTPIQTERNNKFAMYKTTLHAAINFAIIEGYKNVILFGVELEENWNNFHGFNTVRPTKRILKMRELLYEFKSYINIYKTNKNNSLDLEYINIDGLLYYLS